MDSILGVPGWLILGLLTAYIGQTKNRSAFNWFILSLIFPIIALVCVVFVEPLPKDND